MEIPGRPAVEDPETGELLTPTTRGEVDIEPISGESALSDEPGLEPIEAELDAEQDHSGNARENDQNDEDEENNLWLWMIGGAVLLVVIIVVCMMKSKKK